jgi:CubicO group peptidase (beta-lactamase class C family)
VGGSNDRVVHRFACAVLVLAATAPTAQAQTATDLSQLLDPLIERQLRDRDIAGAVTIVVDNGRTVYSHAAGLADVASRRPMTTGTVLRLASISKVFTAIAVMQLIESGKLDLDQDLNRYVDIDVPPSRSGRAMTLRRVLSHRGGFEDTLVGIASLTGPRSPLVDFLPRRLPPYLPQDDGVVSYSNYGFAVAAHAVERASQEPFERYVERHIFQPLGMSNTTADQPLPARLLSVASSGYNRAAAAPTWLSMADATIHEVGSTGIASTPEDMARFITALLDPPPGFLSEQSIAIMREKQTPAPNGSVGIGLYSPVASGMNSFIGHDGGSGGLHGTLALLPQRGIGVFTFYNSAGIASALPPEGELLQAMAARWLGDSQSGAARPDAPVAGTYQPNRRTESSLLKVASLLEQVKVRDGGDGRVRINSAFMPIGGIELREDRPGLFRGRGLEVSFMRSGFSGMEAQIGIPVLRYTRVPWWTSASVVVPAVFICLLFTVVVTARLLWRVARRRPAGSLPGRLALLSNAAAILATLWLVTAGRGLAAIAPPTLPLLVAVIYFCAWAGVVLAAIAVRHVMRVRGVTGFWRESAVATVAVFMSLFCVAWQIAGTTLIR